MTMDRIADRAESRLDVWLARELAGRFSRSRIQRLIREGAVQLDGRPVECRTPVCVGARIRIRIPPPVPAENAPAPENLFLDVRFEDADLLVINKPAGQVVHPAPGHPGGTLVNALLHHCRDLGGINGILRPGIVHRIDRDTSGLLVVAKNDRAMGGLMAAFKSGQVAKTYLAIVHGHPSPPVLRIESPIGRHPVHRQKMAVRTRGGRRAVTGYQVTETLDRSALLAVRIETGRTHQIRVHMAAGGHPLLGDPLYGSASRDRALNIPIPRIMLHAWKLGFLHPVSGNRMTFEQPPPVDFECTRRHLCPA